MVLRWLASPSRSQGPREQPGKMRREGRQHGWVRTRAILTPPYYPRPTARVVNLLDTSPPAAGVFVKAPSKPTNHSKFTSRCSTPACRGCRDCPPCKSMGKAKGTGKLRGLDAAATRRLARQGASATNVVAQLTGEEEEEEEEEEEDAEEAASEGSHGEELQNDECDGEWFLVGATYL